MFQHSDTVFRCDFCEKTFKTPYALKDHVVVHTKEKRHICYICGEAFGHHSGLRVHIKKHTGDKTYSCQTCGKSFHTSSHLRSHSFVHELEKRHRCVSMCFGEQTILRSIYLVTQKQSQICEIWYRFKSNTTRKVRKLLHNCQPKETNKMGPLPQLSAKRISKTVKYDSCQWKETTKVLKYGTTVIQNDNLSRNAVHQLACWERAELLAFRLYCVFFMPSWLFVFLSCMLSGEVCGIRLYRFLIIVFSSMFLKNRVTHLRKTDKEGIW